MKRKIFMIAIGLLAALQVIPVRARYDEENQWIEPVFRERHIEEMIQTHEVSAVITAYCPCAKCCGNWAYHRPNGVVYTASGAVARTGVTVGVNPNVIPYGAHILIDGHEYIAQDTGNGLANGVHIDIYCNSHKEALQIGLQKKTIVWWVD